jgi:hypothetical protein
MYPSSVAFFGPVHVVSNAGDHGSADRLPEASRMGYLGSSLGAIPEHELITYVSD